jgi:hypothetical protein
MSSLVGAPNLFKLHPKMHKNPLIIFIKKWWQLHPLGKMFNHNQHILIMTDN